MSEETTGRPGSAADLSRRMDALERNHNTLAGTVQLIEANQRHAEELNKMRFESLETAVKGVGTDLKGFMLRIEGMISGEVETVQSREGRALVADYKKWREKVDTTLDQVRLMGRLGVLLVTSNLLAIAAAIYAIAR